MIKNIRPSKKPSILICSSKPNDKIIILRFSKEHYIAVGFKTRTDKVRRDEIKS